nr:hypothetical protein [Alteraurantiacibacter buctensis]
MSSVMKVIVGARDAGIEPFTKRHPGAAPQADPVKAAISGFQEAATVLVRHLGEQLDRAAQRVLARQGALRPAQDFDPLQVNQVKHRAKGRAVIDIVDVDADARFQREAGIVLPDTADVGAERVGVDRGRLRQVHVGHVLADVGNGRLVARLDCLGRDGSDRQRCILQTLLAELGGDGNHVVAAIFGRILRPNGLGQTHHQRDERGLRQAAGVHVLHRSSP